MPRCVPGEPYFVKRLNLRLFSKSDLQAAGDCRSFETVSGRESHRAARLSGPLATGLTGAAVAIRMRSSLGDRLAAGRRVLAPLTEVRILVPQPTSS